MASAEEWLASIRSSPRDAPVTAHGYRGIRFKSTFDPVVLGCSDGDDYVVKAPKNAALRRAVCNEQVIGRLGTALSAPVPAVKIVQIPQALIDEHPVLAGIPAGSAHASRYVPGASQVRQGIQHASLPANRERFALLAILYAIAGAVSDPQFFYEGGSNLAWSFDHGHFFPGGPNWTIASLAACRAAVPDKRIVKGCGLTPSELQNALRHLDGVSEQALSQAVASPDDAWGLSDNERVALAQHLDSRIQQLRTLPRLDH